MKLNLVKSKKTLIIVVISTMIFTFFQFSQTAFSQTQRFTMEQLLTAIVAVKEKRTTFAKIIKDVKNRKVDFALTKENEKLLRDEGASNSLIKAIRKNSLSLKYSSDNAESPSSEYDYFYSAFGCYQKKDYSCVIKDCSKAIELKPDYDEPYLFRGLAYMRKSNYDQAIKDFSKLIELKPDNAASYYRRGVAYYNKADFDHAIADFRKALELAPDYEEAKKNLDLALRMKNNQ